MDHTSHPAEAATRENGDLQKAMELIGAGNDLLSRAERQANINEAWHILRRLSTHQQRGAESELVLEALAHAERLEKWDWPETDFTREDSAALIRRLAAALSRAPQPDTVKGMHK